MATLYTAKPSPTASVLSFGELTRRGVLLDQEFEFTLHCKDMTGTPVAVDVEAHIRIQVLALYGPGNEISMPITIREDKLCVGKYIIRTMCARSPMSMNAGIEATLLSITVAVDGIMLNEPNTITAVRMCAVR